MTRSQQPRSGAYQRSAAHEGHDHHGNGLGHDHHQSGHGDHGHSHGLVDDSIKRSREACERCSSHSGFSVSPVILRITWQSRGTVRGHQHTRMPKKVGDDGVVPVGKHALHHVLQALGPR